MRRFQAVLKESWGLGHLLKAESLDRFDLPPLLLGSGLKALLGLLFMFVIACCGGIGREVLLQARSIVHALQALKVAGYLLSLHSAGKDLQEFLVSSHSELQQGVGPEELHQELLCEIRRNLRLFDQLLKSRFSFGGKLVQRSLLRLTVPDKDAEEVRGEKSLQDSFTVGVFLFADSNSGADHFPVGEADVQELRSLVVLNLVVDVFREEALVEELLDQLHEQLRAVGSLVDAVDLVEDQREGGVETRVEVVLLSNVVLERDEVGVLVEDVEGKNLGGDGTDHATLLESLEVDLSKSQEETEFVGVSKNPMFVFCRVNEILHHFVKCLGSLYFRSDTLNRLSEYSLHGLLQEVVVLVEADELFDEGVKSFCAHLRRAHLVHLRFNHGREAHHLAKQKSVDLGVLHHLGSLRLLQHKLNQLHRVDTLLKAGHNLDSSQEETFFHGMIFGAETSDKSFERVVQVSAHGVAQVASEILFVEQGELLASGVVLVDTGSSAFSHICANCQECAHDVRRCLLELRNGALGAQR